MKTALTVSAVMVLAGTSQAAFSMANINLGGGVTGGTNGIVASTNFYSDPGLVGGTPYQPTWWGAGDNRVAPSNFGFPGGAVPSGAAVRDAWISSTFVGLQGRKPGAPGDGNPDNISGSALPPAQTAVLPQLNSSNFFGLNFSGTGNALQGGFSYALGQGIGTPSAPLDLAGGTYEAILFARGVVPQGETVTLNGEGPLGNIIEIGLGVEGNADTISLDAGGAPTQFNGDFYQVFVDVTNFTARDGTAVTAFDFYVVQNLPTPGAAALLGLAGLAGLRRRR